MMDIKKASPLATLALAGALLGGCGYNSGQSMYESNAEIAEGYDISLQINGSERVIRVGSDEEKQNHIYAISFDGDNSPDKIELRSLPKDHPLRKLASPAKLEQIADHLEDRESYRGLLRGLGEDIN